MSADRRRADRREESGAAASNPDPVYPLPRSLDDPRYAYGVGTFDLTLDAAQVLERHGYPPLVAGEDVLRLQRAIRWFLHDIDPGVTR